MEASYPARRVTRQGELLGNGEIPAVIETNSSPG